MKEVETWFQQKEKINNIDGSTTTVEGWWMHVWKFMTEKEEEDEEGFRVRRSVSA